MALSRNSRVFLRTYSCRIQKTPNEKAIQVCILGADTPTGRAASFLLKQNPLVSHLHLQGNHKVESIGIDLSQFDTSCKVHTYINESGVPKAVKSADVVLMLGLSGAPKTDSIPKRVMAEASRMTQLAQVCARYAPKAILVVCAFPVSVMLPLVSEVYRTTHWYHPGRILGSVAFAQLKANSLMGQYLNLDPHIVSVPIVGGPDLCCALPLFSQASPVGVTGKDADTLIGLFRKDHDVVNFSSAFGLNNLIINMALGICDLDEGLVTVFMRSNIVNTCRYMVSTVKVTKGGVIHNYGLPILSKAEFGLFEKSSLILRERDRMAHDYLTCPKKTKHPEFLLREMEEEAVLKKGVVK